MVDKQITLQRKLFLLLVALTLTRGLIYVALTIPWWQGHDEEYHFAQSRLLVDKWISDSLKQYSYWPQEMMASFVVFPDSQWTRFPERPPDLVHIPSRYTYFERNSLSYYFHVWVGQFLVHQDLLFQLFAYRLISVVLTCGIVSFAFLSGRVVFPKSTLAQILVPWLILFNPAFMITASTVRDGNLATLLATTVFYLLLLVEQSRKHIAWQLPLALGLTVLAFWAKPTTYYLFIIWSVLLATYLWRLGWKYRLFIGVMSGLFIITFMVFIPDRFQSDITYYVQNQISSEGLDVVLSFKTAWVFFGSFWVVLGYAIYRLVSVWYMILLILVLLAILGLSLYGWRHYRQRDTFQKSLLLALLFTGAAITVWIGAAIIRYSNEFTGNLLLARYIFPIIVPLSILIVAGWRELLPSIWRNSGLVFFIAFFFFFDTMVWLNYAIPWYYPFWPN